MKILFVGDVHNHTYIFKDVQRLDKEHNFDRIIFLGDYVDDWNTTNKESLETLDTVIKLKNNNPTKYIFCIGNHELSYLGYPCSGHQKEMDNLVRLKLTQNINKFVLYSNIELNNKVFYCSHSGFTNNYLINELQPENTKWEDNIKLLNTDILDKLKLLTPCSYFRGGSYPYSSFVWTDKRELMYNTESLLIPYQIVGHTPVQVISSYISNTEELYFIDTHSTYRDGTCYGDKSYLMWNEDKFEILK